jgi:hypothetical protein
MDRLTPKLDMKRVAQFITTNTAGGQLSEDFNRSSFLGAKAAGVAQRLRQSLIGDTIAMAKHFGGEPIRDPVAFLAVAIESAHVKLAMSRNRIGAAAIAGDEDTEGVNEYYAELLSLYEFHNDGVNLLKDATTASRESLLTLLSPLHDELVHANSVYRKRLLGVF